VRLARKMRRLFLPPLEKGRDGVGIVIARIAVMTAQTSHDGRLHSAPLRPVRLGPADYLIERKADGTIHLRSPHPLDAYADNLTQRLEHWAKVAPERIFLAQRRTDGSWRTLTYAQALAQVRSIAQALLERQLSAERPVAILSGNDIEHALLGLAAMHVGIPYAPISVPYSLMSTDFGKLKSIIEILTPGLVFAADGKVFAHAIDAAVPPPIEIAVTSNPPPGRRATFFADLVAATPTDAVDKAHARVGPDTVAKILFTSGSTGYPKGVINTQRMLCANQAQVRAGLAFVRDEPPVIVDWLPWNHTFGANHNFNLVLDNGGSLYIDEGKPLPGAIAATARNLKEIAPTIYFNVPKGYEMLLPHLRADAELRRNFFSRLKVLFYAGAALQQYVWDELQEMSVATCGERIIFISSIGSTETSPLALACNWDFPVAGNIGLPAPGVELKLVPNEGKLEARLKGPNITPGYWRRPDLTAEAFDEEGYYKIGDALKFVDPANPGKGLLFDGRIAEDFKLASGTWVSAGALRARFVDYCAPLVRDAVIAGADRDDIAVLVFPDIEACRKLASLPADAPPAAVLADYKLRAEFRRRLDALARTSTGSSTRICRLLLMEEPPSLDAGEATDKGSINQRAVLARRAALVEELYADPLSPRAISIDA
jgi:feruloyl-CoA synthase